MGLIERGNEALKINPPTGDTFFLSRAGSDWLWAVTAVYCLSLLIVISLAFVAPRGEKIFHYLFTVALFVGSVTYFAMASDLGSTPVPTVDNAPGTREIFYARYINWFTAWPELIIAVGLLSGVSWATIIFNIALSWIWVASWLSGALVHSTYKWGFFVFGTFSYFILAASLLFTGIVTAKRANITTHYLGLGGWLVFLWFLYPIAWGLDDGGNVIRVTSGFIFFGILDILMVPPLAFAFLALSTKWDYRALNIYFTQYGRVAPGEFSETQAPREKAPPAQQQQQQQPQAQAQPATVTPEQTA